MPVKGPLIVNDIPSVTIDKNIRKDKVHVTDIIHIFIVVKPIQIFIDQCLKARYICPHQALIKLRFQCDAITELKCQSVSDIVIDCRTTVDCNLGSLIAS